MLNPKPLLPIYDNETAEEKAARQREQDLEDARPSRDDNIVTALSKWMVRHPGVKKIFYVAMALLLVMNALQIEPVFSEDVAYVSTQQYDYSMQADGADINPMDMGYSIESRRQLAHDGGGEPSVLIGQEGQTDTLLHNPAQKEVAQRNERIEPERNQATQLGPISPLPNPERAQPTSPSKPAQNEVANGSESQQKGNSEPSPRKKMKQKDFVATPPKLHGGPVSEPPKLDTSTPPEPAENAEQLQKRIQAQDEAKKEAKKQALKETEKKNAREFAEIQATIPGWKPTTKGCKNPINKILENAQWLKYNDGSYQWTDEKQQLWEAMQDELEDDLREHENRYRSDKSLSEDIREQLKAITAAFRCGGPQSSVMMIVKNNENATTSVEYQVQSSFMLTGQMQWDIFSESVMEQTVESNEKVLTPVLRQFYKVIGPSPKWTFAITKKVKEEHLVTDKDTEQVKKKALDNDERQIRDAINGIFDRANKAYDLHLEIHKIEKGHDDDSEKMKIVLKYGGSSYRSFIQLPYDLYWHGDFEKNKEKLSKLLNQEYQPEAPPNYVSYQLSMPSRLELEI